MDRMRKIAAWAGLILLAVLILATFILGVFGGPETHNLFMACAVCTVVVPVLMYAMMLIARMLRQGSEEAEAEVKAMQAAAEKEAAEATAGQAVSETAEAAAGQAVSETADQ